MKRLLSLVVLVGVLALPGQALAAPVSHKASNGHWYWAGWWAGSTVWDYHLSWGTYFGPGLSITGLTVPSGSTLNVANDLSGNRSVSCSPIRSTNGTIVYKGVRMWRRFSCTEHWRKEFCIEHNYGACDDADVFVTYTRFI